MSSIFNPSSVSVTGLQPETAKGQINGYLGLGAEKEVEMPGKVGFNGVSPVGKATTQSALPTNVSVNLVEAITINTPLNNQAKTTNAILECLRKVGLME